MPRHSYCFQSTLLQYCPDSSRSVNSSLAFQVELCWRKKIFQVFYLIVNSSYPVLSGWWRFSVNKYELHSPISCNSCQHNYKLKCVHLHKIIFVGLEVERIYLPYFSKKVHNINCSLLEFPFQYRCNYLEAFSLNFNIHQTHIF